MAGPRTAAWAPHHSALDSKRGESVDSETNSTTFDEFMLFSFDTDALAAGNAHSQSESSHAWESDGSFVAKDSVYNDMYWVKQFISSYEPRRVVRVRSMPGIKPSSQELEDSRSSSELEFIPNREELTPLVSRSAPRPSDLVLFQHYQGRYQCVDCESFYQSKSSNTFGPSFSRSEGADNVEWRASQCHGCALIASAVRLFRTDQSLLSFGNTSYHLLKLSDTHDRSEEFPLYIEMVTKQGFIWPFLAPLASSPEYPYHTMDDNSILKTISILRNCDEHHRCLVTDSDWLPTRLLDISSNNVRLSTSPHPPGRYVALSHRWSDHKTFVTVRSNVDERKQSIPWDDMPLTFQESISLSRKLDIRYIWIDSLCIIQDDGPDWEREASKMALVYRNAYATIGADLGRDGLFSAVPTRFQPKKTTLPHPLDPACSYLTYFRQSGYEKHAPGELSERGWIFQERLLSSRYIWCKPAEIIVDCFEATVCNCTEETQVSHGPCHWTKRVLGTTLIQRIYKNEFWFDSLEKAVHSKWRTAVEGFSRCKLSFGKDVFPALSGLAKVTRLKDTNRYLAGIWADDLIRGLMWKRDEEALTNSVPTGRPSVWRAPSWSWASTLQPCSYKSSWAIKLDGDLNIKVADLQAEVKPKGTDPTGEIVEGHLNVAGRLVEGQIFYGDDLTSATLRIDQRFDGHGEAEDIHGEWKLGRHRFDYDINHPGPSSIPSGAQVSILLWVRSHMEDDHFALILKRKESADGLYKHPVYERIGHCGDTLSPDEGHDVVCDSQGNMFRPEFCSRTCRALREGILWNDIESTTLTIV